MNGIVNVFKEDDRILLKDYRQYAKYFTPQKGDTVSIPVHTDTLKIFNDTSLLNYPIKDFEVTGVSYEMQNPFNDGYIGDFVRVVRLKPKTKTA